MSFVVWNEDYSTVKVMDDQHKRLFDLINKLHDAIKARKSKEVVGTVLRGLIEYTKTHFAEEEELLEKFNYAGLEEQKAAHRSFVDKIVEFQDKFDSGELLISVEIVSYLKDWLINHIKGVDMKYTETFKQNNLC